MNKSEITVIDYGLGNLLSVQRAFEYCGATVVMTSNPDCVANARRLVLPGVGAFGDAMEALNGLGLAAAILAATKRAPLLGICLGMQLLLDESDEFGLTRGLGIIPGRVEAIPDISAQGEAQKIPHIGWNGLLSGTAGSWTGSALEGVRQGAAVYFVHSFMAVPTDPAHQLADCVYGGHRVAAVLKSGNITACQFHPEKSGEVGLKILRSFMSA
jgi:glutamine amidotransferase